MAVRGVVRVAAVMPMLAAGARRHYKRTTTAALIFVFANMSVASSTD